MLLDTILNPHRVTQREKEKEDSPPFRSLIPVGLKQKPTGYCLFEKKGHTLMLLLAAPKL
ncbi:conserved hypothetical protein [Ricinus communis]|uniref:Uncharacterized protein n=1 Tax=Ricinus communis TaxID=3988 RepID=B9T0D1_RICCO|nr:conserved hypothetical protein [Ricinus communis]